MTKGRKLTPQEIQLLINFHRNTSEMMQPRMVSAFTKEETIQILNAVTDRKVSTEDGVWKITYRDNYQRFFVKPASGNFVPCGNFITKNVMERLEL